MKRSRHPERSTGKRPKMSLSELAKKRVEVKQSVSESVTLAAGKFLEAAVSSSTSALLDASCNWDTRVCEMFLVARLGLTGTEGLRLAHHLIPKQYGSKRNQLAAVIMNSFFATELSETECGVLLSFMEEKCSPYCNMRSNSDHLRRLTRARTVRHLKSFWLLLSVYASTWSVKGGSWISISQLLSQSLGSLVHEKPPNSLFDAQHAVLSTTIPSTDEDILVVKCGMSNAVSTLKCLIQCTVSDVCTNYFAI